MFLAAQFVTAMRQTPLGSPLAESPKAVEVPVPFQRGKQLKTVRLQHLAVKAKKKIPYR